MSASHEQDQVEVLWDYPRLDFSGNDRMIRFRLLAKMEGDGRFSATGPGLIMRQNEVSRYRAHLPYDPARERFDVMVQAIDVTGTIIASSDPITVETGKLVVPASALTINSALNADGHVELSWPVSPQPEVAGYDLVRIRYSDGDSLMLNTEPIPLLENRFTDRDVVPGETYLYYLYHVTRHGIRSARGNPAPRLIEDWTPPGNPSALTVSYDTSSTDITLNWQPGEQTDNFLTFVLLRKKIHPQFDEAWTQINDSTVTGGPHTDTGAGGQVFVEGATYRYGVAAANRNAMRSDTVFADIRIPVLTPPNAPSYVDARIDYGLRVRLNWNASGSGDVTEYRIYRLISPVPFRTSGTSHDGSMTDEPGQIPDDPFPFPLPAPPLGELRQAQAALASSPANNERFYIDDSTEAGASYIYHVTAVDSAGNESAPSPGFGIRVQRTNVVPPVRNLQALAGPDGVMIRWEPLADAEGLTYHYRVMRSELANGEFETLADAISDVEWTDSGGQAGHWYRIVAVDDAGSRGRPSPARQAISRR
ncbi:MAG: hypothetical protein EA364_02255 [Balneolaceae bacterium]|nr:MAG: hypothetical protein EA364_02255 [Balneolaceae bacterium]